jgi:hypothetical protein
MWCGERIEFRTLVGWPFADLVTQKKGIAMAQDVTIIILFT